MSTPKPPKTIRDNEFSADYLLWQASISGNNDEQLARLKKNLRQAQLDALTDRQREMVQM